MASFRRAFPTSPAQRRVLILTVLALGALVGLDFLVEHHGAFGIDGTPGFAAWYGFAAAMVAVALSFGWAVLAAGKRRDGDD